MLYATIGILIIFFIILVIKIYTPIVQKKKLKTNLIEYLKKSNMTYVESSSKELYDLKIITNDKTFYVKFVIIPSYSEIQINNQSTWEVKYGAGDKVGKVQPHKRYLSEIISFMRNDFEENCQKIVIFSPTPKKIVKYLNENEIDFVTSNTDVYGARITSIGKYDVFKNKK
jgi:hypothetical protein